MAVNSPCERYPAIIIMLSITVPVTTLLLARVALLIVLVPAVQRAWFAPFVEQFLENPSFTPWTVWQEAGGADRAFPYGPGHDRDGPGKGGGSVGR